MGGVRRRWAARPAGAMAGGRGVWGGGDGGDGGVGGSRCTLRGAAAAGLDPAAAAAAAWVEGTLAGGRGGDSLAPNQAVTPATPPSPPAPPSSAPASSSLRSAGGGGSPAAASRDAADGRSGAGGAMVAVRTCACGRV